MTDIKTINSADKQEIMINTAQSMPTQNYGSDEVSNSWATTVSQYLVQRRIQTQSAYQSQLLCIATDKAEGSENELFEALFELLVQRLEEGHTVLVLETTNANTSNLSLFNDQSDLFVWQQQLLQPLFQPLLSVLLSINTAELSVSTLLEEDSLWEAAMRLSPLADYEKRLLNQRRHTCVQLYQSLKHIASSSVSEINSLSIFKKSLNQQPLFTESREETNNISSPIVFQVDNNSNNEVTKITLWLHRTWQAEYALAQHIFRIKNQNLTKLAITPNSQLITEQQDAIHMANRSAFSIITGGPGTGKTFTVAQLVMALQQAQTEDESGIKSAANLALAAPTGKAAQRMQESLQYAIQQAGVSMQLPEAKTIHRLLGIGQGGQPRYHQNNPLSEDIVIVDEASMLGVELANHLVSAIKPNARLILLGDANQLAAVDAGAVLADLCRIPVLQDVHQRLVASRRFTDESGIGKLAKLINQGEKSDGQNMASVWQLFQEDKALDFYHLTVANNSNLNINNLIDPIKNSLSNFKFPKNLSKNYLKYFNQSKKTLNKTQKAKSMPTEAYLKDFNELIATLNQFRVLTAGHHGRCGDYYINNYLSEQHKSHLKLPLSKSPWYHGRPVMVLQNNYELGLFNGDIGICLQVEKGRHQVFFENKKQGINTNMLSDEMIATAYAMTIHKSQGSEFDHVAISFDDNNVRLLSQELIYTAVTRAKKQVTIFSTASALTLALKTPTVRQTGLSLQFEKLVE